MTDTGATSQPHDPLRAGEMFGGSATPVARPLPPGETSAALSHKLRVLDLFSGIGGFSLGLERTGGFETVAFCEIEPFPRRVLAKHWPGVPIYEDVRTLTADTLARDGIGVDVICGGFPCQDLSAAGRQAGLAGERSGLWSEIVRLISDLRPRYIIVENVASLLSGPSFKRGGWFGRILGDLAECGYDAEWQNIPAGALGAPHERQRFWGIAYPHEMGSEVRYFEIARRSLSRDRLASLAHSWGCAKPSFIRMGDGVSDDVDRIAALGNAVVPQIPELIGHAILASEAALPIAAE
jgi:DNA (cytosine-5)-methyltransferase 1